MIKKLSEKELIEIVSEEEYERFTLETYETMQNSKGYKSKDEIVYLLGISKISEKLNLHFEATLKKNTNS